MLPVHRGAAPADKKKLAQAQAQAQAQAMVQGWVTVWVQEWVPLQCCLRPRKKPKLRYPTWPQTVQLCMQGLCAIEP
jgi:hypothetical protein